MLKLSHNQLVVVEKALDRLSDITKMDVYRSMKKKLVMTFGEENVQIGKIDMDYIIRKLEELGYTQSILSTVDDNRFAVTISSIVEHYMLIVRVPELTIRNSRGNSTIIRDMFVRLYIRPDGLLSRGGMQGVVTTFTKAQARRGYMHSHLCPTHPGLSIPPDFGNFCLGEGPISQLLSLLQNRYDEVNFQMLCLHIKNFLEWESLEGVPHIRMSDNGQSSMGGRLPILSAGTISFASTILRGQFYKQYLQTKKMISVSSDQYQIYVEPTEELEQWVAETIIDKQAAFASQGVAPAALLTLKDDTGNYFSFATDPSPVHASDKTVLTFRGEEIKIKIIDNEQNLKITKYGNPKIIEHLCSKISADLTRTAAAYTYTGNKNTSEDRPKATNTNNDPV